MPVVMQMKWAGVTPEQYNNARETVQWVGDPPEGAIFHVSWFEDDGIRVVDVWDSAEAFQTFVDNRLMPGVQKVGIQGQPEIEIQPTHAVWDPAHNETW